MIIKKIKVLIADIKTYGNGIQFYIIPIEIILDRRQITLYPEGIPESTLKANKNAGYNYFVICN